MKKLIIGVIALIALIAIYFAIQDEDSALTINDVEFKIEDVSKVDRIVLQDRSGKKLDLSKNQDNVWMVNNYYPAFNPFIELFLNKTLSRIELKGPVAKTAKDNVIRNMVGNAIKVDIYEKGEQIKSYYVGEHTPDLKGTYMHIEGSSVPYITYIPGFEGYITPKFNLDATEWYDRSIFDYTVDSMLSVKVTYFQEPQYSFELTKEGSKYSINPPLDLSIQAAKSYFALFSFKNYEGYADYLTQASKDSIKLSTPLLKIEVKDIDGKVKELNVYTKGSDQGSFRDNKGNLLVYDPERYFAVFTGFDKLVTIQDYTFGKLFAKHPEFQN